jgi:hypothetical protein
MFHRRAIAAAALACISIGVSGCSDDASASKRVVVVSGTESGKSWKISAWKEEDGKLCLELDTAGGGMDGTGGCEFSDAPTGGRHLSWDSTDGGPELLFGPVPSAAATVSVTGTGYTIAPVKTLPLPSSAAVGRLFVARLPSHSTTVDIEARDAAGKILRMQDF